MVNVLQVFDKVNLNKVLSTKYFPDEPSAMKYIEEIKVENWELREEVVKPVAA